MVTRPNRPGSGWGWGWDGWHHWHDHWHNNVIHWHYHTWYNGCWTGYWTSAWYVPIGWQAIGWGLGGWYGPLVYVNPYVVQPIVVNQPLAVPFDYSRQVVVRQVPEAAAGDGDEADVPVVEPPQQQAAMDHVDAGRERFREDDYEQALTEFSAAVKSDPGDPVAHELRALAQFALGDYQSAAAVLNSLLSAAPGMDWTTMSGLYSDVEEYTRQLRKLESFIEQHPTDAAAKFVLAYHYLVIGAKDNAITMLRGVVESQPKDMVAQRMLQALAPETRPVVTPEPPPRPGRSRSSRSTADVATDLVGSWVAADQGNKLELTIDESGAFTWKATPKDTAPVELSGNLGGSGAELVLESTDAGAMAGTVRSIDADSWEFRPTDAPPSAAGLVFKRVRSR